MANKMLLDDTRALRREQREARIARKRERREARALKREHQTVGVEELALETIDVRPRQAQVEEPAPAADTVTPEGAGPGHRAGGRDRLRRHRPGPVGNDPQPAGRAQRGPRATRLGRFGGRRRVADRP